MTFLGVSRRERRERKANVREVSMDDAMVEVVDGIKD